MQPESQIEIKRDAMGRMLSQILPDGNISEYAYDKLGNLVEAVNSECAVRLERDTVGRLVREVQGDNWLEYALFDPLGQVTRIATDLGYRIEYDLDQNGYWKGIHTSDGYTIQVRRDAAGQEVERTLPGRLRLDQRLDPVGRLVDQRLSRSGSRGSEVADWSASGWMTMFAGDTHVTHQP